MYVCVCVKYGTQCVPIVATRVLSKIYRMHHSPFFHVTCLI